jgi:tetratricopeptide (TPR) repeat protein
MKTNTFSWSWSIFCIGLFALWACGCATPRESYGRHARYSPAFRGYVMAPESGSDDPSVGDTVVVLRNPLTDGKLRCREEVDEWRAINEDYAADLLHDEHAAIASGVTAVSIFAPLMVLQPLGSLGVAASASTDGLIYEGLKTDDAYTLLTRGVELYRRARYAQAASELERALSKSSAIGVYSKAYYFLGHAYAKLGKADRARLTLGLFVERSVVRDVNAYRKAEATLADLGLWYAPCSRRPVKIHW